MIFPGTTALGKIQTSLELLASSNFPDQTSKQLRAQGVPTDQLHVGMKYRKAVMYTMRALGSGRQKYKSWFCLLRAPL